MEKTMITHPPILDIIAIIIITLDIARLADILIAVAMTIDMRTAPMEEEAQ